MIRSVSFVKESIRVWQPDTNLKAIAPQQLMLRGLIRHEDYFKITVEDLEGNITEIVYDEVHTLEYYVWSFRLTTEMARYGVYYLTDVDESGLKEKGKAYFFKANSSQYIEWFDNQNPLYNSKTNPKLEHHIYITSDDVIEVLSEYEPLFIKKNN